MSAIDQLLRQMSDQASLAWNEETYDLALARALPDADRVRFVTKLVANAKKGDTRAILTLGHLNVIETLPMLRAAANSSDPWAPTARRALVLLGHGAEVIDAIADDALHAPAKMARVAAVMDLPTIGGAKAIATLEAAIADIDSSVRMIAWNGLVAVLDLERWMRSPDGKLEKGSYMELLKDYLASDLPALVRIGVDEIRAIAARIAGGESPAAAGIAWAPEPAPEVFDAIMAAMVDPDAAYPVEQIAKLTGTPRRWAESSLVMRLESSDARVPEALATLHAAWTLPILEESAQTAPPELREKLTTAIGALRAS